MKISVELTFTPLKEDYDAPIQAFIKRLRESPFQVLENPLSTQIYGEYKALMAFLTHEIEQSLEAVGIGLFLVKIVKTDRSAYVPDF